MACRSARSPRLRPNDREGLQLILQDRQLPQYAANRARALLALEQDEPTETIELWTGLNRAAVWYLWRRYRERGVEAIWDAPRSGRPPSFSPSAARAHREDGLYGTESLRMAPGPLGLQKPRSGGG